MWLIFMPYVEKECVMRRSSLIFLPFMLVSTSLLAAPADVKVDVLQNKLDHPWSLAFLPQNQGNSPSVRLPVAVMREADLRVDDAVTAVAW
jgi:glucose/arabinose dehydrogenase